MDGMTGIMKGEGPFLGNAGGEILMDEFMVVPSLVEDQFPTSQLDEFLLEANFEGVTGTILSPPNVDLTQFCTIDGDGGRQASAQADVQGFLFDQSNQHQETFLQQQHQPLDFQSDFSSTIFGAGQQYFDDNFDFDGGQQQEEPVHEETVVFDADWQGGQGEGGALIGQAQLSELEDPDATWLAQTADLNFIEQLSSENDQHCQLLDELLRDDQVFLEPDPSSVDDDDEATRSDETEVSMASEILNEIYREAQELDFAAITPIDRSIVSIPVMSTRSLRAQPTKSSSPQFHLVDHDFGSARRGRPPGSTRKKGGVLKRDLKNKKQHQNREAALRYRLKKKAEKVEKEGELGLLEKRNLFLKTEVHTLTAELKYMKELFMEFRKVRGV